jgi:hypothetical protein
MTTIYGDVQVADLQFANLPNFIKTNERIISICDTSGSMSHSIGGSENLQAIHVSQALALYCSDKIGKENPFYRKFIGFCSESKFKDWTQMCFSQAVLDNVETFDGACGSTQIDLALDLILKTAQFFSLSQEFMPTMLLIISDMQFSESVATHYNYDQTEVERSLQKWTNAGYKVPKIVYWNLVGYAGSPATVHGSHNIGLISGFSPSILSAVLAVDDFSPRGIMCKALEKYHINIPDSY